MNKLQENIKAVHSQLEADFLAGDPKAHALISMALGEENAARKSLGMPPFPVEKDVWIGSLYNTLGNCRVLVLGESTYGNTAPFHVYVPRWCADKERDRTFSCIFGAFPGLKSTSASVMQREAFWAGIAFANFVEPPVGEKADARPTLEHYRKAATLLPDLLKFLKPCVVLILGKGQGKFSAPVITRANIPYVISPHPSRAKKAELQAAWRQVRYWCLRLVTKKP